MYLVDNLYFLHIPKTAGTSFTAFLDDHFDRSNIFPYQTWGVAFRNRHYDFSDFKLVRGHFGYPLCLRNSKIVTFLRNPINRVVSYYNHLKYAHSRGNWPWPFEFSELEQLLKTQPRLFSNTQTRHIGIDLDMALRQNELKYIFEYDPEFLVPTLSDNQLLNQAKNRLNNMFFVGLKEHFQESIRIFETKIGWKESNIEYRRMVSKTHSEISHDTKNKIFDLNQLDLELYKYGCELFGKYL